jgi:hypothetical protein
MAAARRKRTRRPATTPADVAAQADQGRNFFDQVATATTLRDKVDADKAERAADDRPRASTFSYDDVPSVTAFRAKLAAAKRLAVPTDWTKLEAFKLDLADALAEVAEAAHDVIVAANDATGLMCELVDGKRKLDDPAVRMIASVTALRA